MTMFDKIKGFVQKHDMIQKEDRIVLGVSGGADSVCLLFVLDELRKELGFEMKVVHVNHGLRGASADADERFVKDLCEKKSIPYECYFENVELLSKKWKQSTEEAGRNLRRKCLEDTLEKFRGTKIALAHHKNDSVETFFMNLARGTGLKGLGGIAPVQSNVIRPLLCVEREEIEAYLSEQKISYCVDETNAKDDYTRNRVRNHLIPFMEQELNAKTVEHMDETMNYLREVQNFLEEQASIYWNSCVKQEEEMILLSEEYDKVPVAIKPMILKRMLSSVAGCEKDLELIHIRDVEELVEKQVGKKLDLPYGMEAKRVYQGICLSKKQEAKEQTLQEAVFEQGVTDYHFGDYQITCRLCARDEMENSMEKGGTKCFDYDIIKNGISFRGRRVGDYITIDKTGHTQKLKSYFINEKIPQEKRDEILLITDGSHVMDIWEYRDNPIYRITEKTKTILAVRVMKEKNHGRKN